MEQQVACGTHGLTVANIVSVKKIDGYTTEQDGGVVYIDMHYIAHGLVAVQPVRLLLHTPCISPPSFRPFVLKLVWAGTSFDNLSGSFSGIPSSVFSIDDILENLEDASLSIDICFFFSYLI